jgi:hypothetical protein
MSSQPSIGESLHLDGFPLVFVFGADGFTRAWAKAKRRVFRQYRQKAVVDYSC